MEKVLSTTSFGVNFACVAAGKSQRRLGSQLYAMLWLALQLLMWESEKSSLKT